MIKALNHAIPFEEVSTLGGAMLVSDEAEKEAQTLKRKTMEEIESVDNPSIPTV